MATIKHIKKLSQIAREGGCTIVEQDAGYTVAAQFRGRFFTISEMWLPERDGYSGSRTITEDRLREALAEAANEACGGDVSTAIEDDGAPRD